MQYPEPKVDGEQEMSNLLSGQDAQNVVMINGKQVIKKKKAAPKKQVEGQDPLA
jgi:hypothetical protein